MFTGTVTGTVTNTGNVTLIGVVVLSTQPAPNTTVFGPITLAPGAGTNFSGSYKIPANMCSMESLRERLELENEYLKTEVRENFSGLIGKSSALQKVRQKIELVAPTESSVMIIGESGTGKELIARAIHDRSKRRERALVRVNCASIPRELFESEFFGHVRGSFTGAVRDRAGPFQLAHGGTLFLDEVGEIPLDLQSKLLRVLTLGEF